MPMQSVWLQRFRGFVRPAEPTNVPSGFIFVSSRFKGFLNDALPCVVTSTMVGLNIGLFRGKYLPVVPMESVWLHRFQGFVRSTEPTKAPSGFIFFSSRFNGFVNDAPPCVVTSTMARLHKRETVKR